MARNPAKLGGMAAAWSGAGASTTVATRGGTWGKRNRRVLLASVVAVVGIALGLLSQPLTRFVFGGGAPGVTGGVTLVFLAGFPTCSRLRRDLLDPPGLYALLTVTTLGLTSLAWLGNPLEPGPGLNRGDVAAALRLVALGLAIFGVGARLACRSRPVQPTTFPPNSNPSPGALASVFCASLVGIGFAVSLHGYGYISDPTAVARLANIGQLISFVGSVGSLVVLATALAYFGTRNRRLLRPLIVFAFVDAGVGFFLGFKGAALTPLIYVLLAYVTTSGRLPLKAVAAAAIFTFVFVVPANLTYRDALRGAQPTSAGAALRQALSHPPALNPVTVASNIGDYVLTRFRSIDSVALIVRDTPSRYPFADGSTYFGLPAILVVPRAVWHGKPALTEAADFTHTYWGQPAGLNSTTQLTQVGDLYRNFGRVGVIWGLFGWGLILGAAAIMRQRWQSPRAAFFYVYVIVQAVTYVESDLPELIATAAKTLPLVAVLGWFLLPGSDGRQPGYRRMLVWGRNPT